MPSEDRHLRVQRPEGSNSEDTVIRSVDECSLSDPQASDRTQQIPTDPLRILSNFGLSDFYK
jgi:hypothetical protein